MTELGVCSRPGVSAKVQSWLLSPDPDGLENPYSIIFMKTDAREQGILMTDGYIPTTHLDVSSLDMVDVLGRKETFFFSFILGFFEHRHITVKLQHASK